MLIFCKSAQLSFIGTVTGGESSLYQKKDQNQRGGQGGFRWRWNWKKGGLSGVAGRKGGSGEGGIRNRIMEDSVIEQNGGLGKGGVGKRSMGEGGVGREEGGSVGGEVGGSLFMMLRTFCKTLTASGTRFSCKLVGSWNYVLEQFQMEITILVISSQQPENAAHDSESTTKSCNHTEASTMPIILLPSDQSCETSSPFLEE